ncbi:hypothetical protein E2C01_017482 [Portunus trituberculatus]|uniref:Uncharacterized protein n=1 Tax=Portunus trituberculatus TaxID=210409 RepID=A0A5B7DSK5_PORTR|nr:hypothetical protein [Portunus trituberculatus]
MEYDDYNYYNYTDTWEEEDYHHSPLLLRTVLLSLVTSIALLANIILLVVLRSTPSYLSIPPNVLFLQRAIADLFSSIALVFFTAAPTAPVIMLFGSTPSALLTPSPAQDDADGFRTGLGFSCCCRNCCYCLHRNGGGEKLLARTILFCFRLSYQDNRILHHVFGAVKGSARFRSEEEEEEEKEDEEKEVEKDEKKQEKEEEELQGTKRRHEGKRSKNDRRLLHVRRKEGGRGRSK